MPTWEVLIDGSLRCMPLPVAHRSRIYPPLRDARIPPGPRQVGV